MRPSFRGAESEEKGAGVSKPAARKGARLLVARFGSFLLGGFKWSMIDAIHALLPRRMEILHDSADDGCIAFVLIAVVIMTVYSPILHREVNCIAHYQVSST